MIGTDAVEANESKVVCDVAQRGWYSGWCCGTAWESVERRFKRDGEVTKAIFALAQQYEEIDFKRDRRS